MSGDGVTIVRKVPKPTFLLRAENGGGQNSLVIPWPHLALQYETFLVERRDGVGAIGSGDVVFLRSLNGNIVRAVGAGGAELRADVDISVATPGPSESFTIILQPFTEFQP
jgi:hypothetical protein